MNKRLIKGLLCLTMAFSFMLSTSFISTQAAGVPIDFFEQEPNNSGDEANVIQPNKAFLGKLFAENDVDCFSFVNTKDSNLKFLFIPQPGNVVNYGFIIYDSTTHDTIVNYSLPNKEESVTYNFTGKAGHEYILFLWGDRGSNRYYQGIFYQD